MHLCLCMFVCSWICALICMGVCIWRPEVKVSVFFSIALHLNFNSLKFKMYSKALFLFLISVFCVWVGAFGVQRKGWDPLELKLQVVVNQWMWVFGIKLDPLEEQQMFLIAELFLEPLHVRFWDSISHRCGAYILSRLAEQWVPRFLLYLPPQCWDYKQVGFVCLFALFCF